MITRLVLALFVAPRNYFLFLYGCRNASSPVIKSLQNGGFYIFPQCLDMNEIKELRDDFAQLTAARELPSCGQLTGRIYSVGSMSSVFDKYIERFKPIAKDYFRCQEISCELTIYQVSRPQDDVDNIPGGEFHMDDNKKNLKFFIYLNDVSRDQGPFSYVPTTHGFRGFDKLKRLFLWEVFLKRRFLYLDKVKSAKIAAQAVEIVGEAGLVFCADTTGYHRATPVLNGERSVAVISFAERRLDPYRLIAKARGRL